VEDMNRSGEVRRIYLLGGLVAEMVSSAMSPQQFMTHTSPPEPDGRRIGAHAPACVCICCCARIDMNSNISSFSFYRFWVEISVPAWMGFRSGFWKIVFWAVLEWPTSIAGGGTAFARAVRRISRGLRGHRDLQAVTKKSKD